MTKSGTHYENTYCLVYRLFDGKVQKLTEYCDTELVTVVFGRGGSTVPGELDTAAS